MDVAPLFGLLVLIPTVLREVEIVVENALAKILDTLTFLEDDDVSCCFPAVEIIMAKKDILLMVLFVDCFFKDAVVLGFVGNTIMSQDQG